MLQKLLNNSAINKFTFGVTLVTKNYILS